MLMKIIFNKKEDMNLWVVGVAVRMDLGGVGEGQEVNRIQMHYVNVQNSQKILTFKNDQKTINLNPKERQKTETTNL